MAVQDELALNIASSGSGGEFTTNNISINRKKLLSKNNCNEK